MADFEYWIDNYDQFQTFHKSDFQNRFTHSWNMFDFSFDVIDIFLWNNNNCLTWFISYRWFCIGMSFLIECILVDHFDSCL